MMVVRIYRLIFGWKDGVLAPELSYRLRRESGERQISLEIPYETIGRND